MRLKKVCPHCNKIVHVRLALCDCGHAFTFKRKAKSNVSNKIVMKSRRALKFDLRENQDNVNTKVSGKLEEASYSQETNTVQKVVLRTHGHILHCNGNSMHKQEDM